MHHFFKSNLDEDSTLEGEEFQHCVQVLRHREGDQIGLTDGSGRLAKVVIETVSKRSLTFKVAQKIHVAPKKFRIHLFISPTKQVERMEWMVEKAAEMRVDEITFLLTQNAERRKLRLDRLEKKALSALKQSKGAFLTQLNDLKPLSDCFEPKYTNLLAYVASDAPHIAEVVKPDMSVGLFIGPEGDFTKEEVELAKDRGASLISLGKSVLRTETAGLAACHAVNFVNHF